MVVVVVGEGDDCVFEFVVFVGEQPYFVSEYGVAFGFFPVVTDEVVGVFCRWAVTSGYWVLIRWISRRSIPILYIGADFKTSCMSQEIFVSSPSVRSMMFLSMCVTISCMLRR